MLLTTPRRAARSLLRAAALLCAIQPACAGSNSFVRRTTRARSTWKVKLCESSHAAPSGALVARPDGRGWSFVRGATSKEAIVIDVRKHEVCLAEPYPSLGSCPKGLLSLVAAPDNTTACDSKLTTCAVEPLTVIAFPVSALFLSYLCYPHVGSTFAQAVTQSHAIELNYRADFAESVTPDQLAAFADTYAGDDPDGLVPIARAKEEQARLQLAQDMREHFRAAAAAALAAYRQEFEQATTGAQLARFIAQYAANDPDQLVPRARERRAALRAAFERRFAQFRDQLAVGDQTHCGLVVEIKQGEKGRIVQVQTVPGTYWLPLTSIYPPGGGPCVFHNDEYREPDLELDF
jgi:hypothetical protein